MIDLKAFRNAFQGFDKEILEDIISIYISQHTEKFQDMEQALHEKNFDKLRFVSHGLKGVLSQFYANTARDQAKDLEFQAKELASMVKEQPGFVIEDDQVTKLKSMIERLKSSCLVVMEELNQIVSTY